MFQKGTSGNPKGRPVGARGHKAQVAYELSNLLKARSSPKAKTTNLQKFMKSVLDGAMKGSKTDKLIMANWIKGNTDLLDMVDAEEKQIMLDDIEYPKYKIASMAFDITGYFHL